MVHVGMACWDHPSSAARVGCSKDIYAMNLPLFLPDLAGLHRVAVTYFARFRMSLDVEMWPS
jgi:hypothetical protein